MKKLLLILALSVCAAYSQIAFNARGAWQASTLYTVGDTFTCSATTYYVAATEVSGASCLLSSTGNADLVPLNYTAVGSLPDELLSLSYPRILNNFYFVGQHMFDKAAYNDLTQISTPAAPGTGLLRFYAKANAICWIAPGGSEQCAGSSILAGDVTGATSANTVVKLQNRTLAATAPTDGQYIGYNLGATQWEPKSLVYRLFQANSVSQTARGKLNFIPGTNITINVADNAGADSTDVTLLAAATPSVGSLGVYQKAGAAGTFAAANMSDDANGRPSASKGINAPAFAVTYSATPAYDIANGNRQEITLSGNVTAPTWVHLKAGDHFSLALKQDGTGSHSALWPVSTLNACSPWQVANSVTTVAFEVDSDGATVYATNCSVYDPANPGVVFYGLMRGSIPTPAAGNLACGFDSGANDWHCVDPTGKNYYATLDRAAVSHQFVTGISAGVQSAAQPAFTDISGTATTAQTPTAVLDGSVAYCADAGSTDDYACNLSPAPGSYVTGARYRFKANTANTGAATINFNALGAKTIVKVAGGITTALADSDIRVGQVVDAVYDGTNMQIQSTLGNTPAPVAGTNITVAGSTISWNRGDRKAAGFDELFCGGQWATSTQNGGQLGWGMSNITAGTPTATQPAATDYADSNHICGIKVAPAATISDGAIIYDQLATINSHLFQAGSFRTTTVDLDFQLSKTTDIAFYAGLNSAAAIPAANGFSVSAHIRYDTTLGTPDTGWVACVDNGGGTGALIVCSALSGTLDANAHHLSITTTAAGSWSFTLDGGTATNITRTVNDNIRLMPFYAIVNGTATTNASIWAWRFTTSITGITIN